MPRNNLFKGGKNKYKVLVLWNKQENSIKINPFGKQNKKFHLIIKRKALAGHT